MATTRDDNSSTKGEDPTAELSFLAQKHEEEKARRLRADGGAQYDEFASCRDARLSARPPNLADGQHVKVLALGAGVAGLVYTTHLVETGGFGGTWSWNRFPGLACDVEASIYLPWLERTGYRPRHRYARGQEIQHYLEGVAEKWGLDTKGVFRTRVVSLAWDEGRRGRGLGWLRRHDAVRRPRQRRSEPPQGADAEHGRRHAPPASSSGGDSRARRADAGQGRAAFEPHATARGGPRHQGPRDGRGAQALIPDMV